MHMLKFILNIVTPKAQYNIHLKYNDFILFQFDLIHFNVIMRKKCSG